MRLLTPEQALELDRATFARPEFRSADFIRDAAVAVLGRLEQLALIRRTTLVLIGPGNNGQDGRLVAEGLKRRGTSVQTWVLGEQTKLEAGIFDRFEVVVDALFGVGLNREVEGLAHQVIETLNQVRHSRRQTARPLFVLAVDVPSGLNALTGWPRGVALKADDTVTMQAAKPGFFQNRGPHFTGSLMRAKLPYPEKLFAEIASTHFACGINAAHALLPSRPLGSNKGDHGVVNVVAGSAKYPGAGVLCARSALRTGVGYVRLIQFEDVYPDWFQIPETLFEKWTKLPPKLDSKPSWVVGPGLTDEDQMLALIEGLLAQHCPRVTLDASALAVLAKTKLRLPADWILTPHPKELAGLLQTSVKEIQSDRFAAAALASEKWGATILLKGYKTVVCAGGKQHVILRGNSVLAKAGSGDVLAGLIASLRAQGLEASAAAVGGAYLHAFAADLWLRDGDRASLTPSDLIELLPSAQKQIRAWRRP